jgi:ABC-type nitrate/sulfonate/bicarbonate transport system ATPase subunit
MISLTDIVQKYPDPSGEGTVTIVDGVSLTIEEPGIYMLLGPSGCGKSTVMRLMGGVRPYGVASPTSGEVTIDDVPCTGAHDDAVMVFQQYSNLPWLSVRDNVALPFRLKLWRDKVPEEEREARIDWILERVGLADRADNLPSQLSGGQNQRLALAQALVLKPRILLMDEPFGALDAQTRHEMQELLLKLLEEQQCVVVFVTHDITEALILGDRITVLSTKPATVAKEFELDAPRPRSELWLRSTVATTMRDEILDLLHSDNGGGQIRVTV